MNSLKGIKARNRGLPSVNYLLLVSKRFKPKLLGASRVLWRKLLTETGRSTGLGIISTKQGALPPLGAQINRAPDTYDAYM